MTPQIAAPVADKTTGGSTTTTLSSRHNQYTTNRPAAQPRGKNQRLAWACRYALQGLAVFPCNGKAPLTEHGYKDATTDLETIGAWWARWPAANIGLPMAPNGLVAIDVDPRNGGTLAALDLPAELRTWRAATGGGGQHVIFAAPSIADLPGALGAGIDVKYHGYVIVAPSVHPETGKQYKWAAGLSPFDLDPAPMPMDLVETLRKLAKPALKPRQAQHHDHGAASGFSGVFCDLLDKIGVTFDRAGGDQLVLCPFHDDDDPSLHVDVDRAVYHCFAPGCAAFGGGGYMKLVQIAQAFGYIGDGTETTIDEAWRLSRDEWNTCPQCRRLVVQRLETGQWVSYHPWCKSPDCTVWKKVQCRRYLSRLRQWEHIGIVTVDEVGADKKARIRAYRKARDMVKRGSSDYIGVCALVPGAGPMDEPVYRWSIAYNAGSDDPEAALSTMTAAVMTKAPGRRVAQPHKPKADKPEHVKPVFDFRLVIAPSRRRDVLRILAQLGIEVKRKPYGGWETTGPVDAEKDVVLQATLRRLATQPGYYLGESSIATTDDALSSDKRRTAAEPCQPVRVEVLVGDLHPDAGAIARTMTARTVTSHGRQSG